MLRRIEFENFMSLKDVGVDLRPLTVFIGSNGSGKSAIFKGLVTLSKLLTGGAVRGPKGDFYLEPGVTLDDLVWSGNSGLPIKFRDVRSIGFKSDWQGVRLTFTTDRSEDPIPAPQESDGVLLATFLFWRLYTGGPATKICLEEPENGLHAFLLAERFQALKMFACGRGVVKGKKIKKVARRRPILITCGRI